MTKNQGSLQNSIFIAVCAAFLLFVLLWAPCHRLAVKLGFAEYREMGNIIENETVHEGFLAPVLNRIEDGKTLLRETYINYLPGYVEAVTAWRDAEFKLNSGSNALLTRLAEKKTPDETPIIGDGGEAAEALPFKPVVIADFITQDDTHRYYDFHYIDENGNEVAFLDRGVNRTAAQIQAMTEQNLGHINRIADVCARYDVNCFLFPCLRVSECDFWADIAPTEPNLRKYVDYIFDGVRENVHYSYFDMPTLQHRVDWVYATDHHWNATGAHEGYTRVMDLINGVDYISEVKQPIKSYSLTTCRFYGSCARRTGYMKYYDPMTFNDYGLPYHRTTNGAPLYDKIEQYLCGMFSRDSGVGHYEAFNGAVTKFVFPENKTGRNLLIITDSFGEAVNEVIASHFDTTHCRYIWNKDRMNLNDFIEDNNITDLLILQLTNRLLADVANDCRFDAIITE